MSEHSSSGGVPVPSGERATLTLTRKLLTLAFAGVGLWYLSWRPSVFNPEAPLLSSLVYGAEVFGFVCALLYIVTCWRLRQRTAEAPPEGATVAAFIKTVHESIDIVRRTAMAAQRMRQATEVWLLDDGNRLEMQVLAQELGCRYLSRAKGMHSQADTLNAALRQSSAEFIAIFAAHDVPARNFLDETLGFFRDGKVAFVQTAQDFYNLDSFQHRRDRRQSLVWSEQALTSRVLQPGRDRLDAAHFCGSCAVLRHAALDAIGGFATGTVGADMRTTIRLHKLGWKSVYYARSLAFGLAPANATAFLGQRLSWGRGAMQAWRHEGVLTAGGLSLGQRIAYLATMLAYFQGWQRLVVYLAPVAVLVTGKLPILDLDREFLARFVLYCALGCWVFEELARGYGRTVLTAQYDMMRFAVFMAATCEVFVRKVAFLIAPGPRTGATARVLWPQYAVLGLNVFAIALGLLQFNSERGLPAGGLVATVTWAALIVGIAVLAIRHARTTARDRRREYRFPLPVPLRVWRPGGQETVALATDISPLGCRIVGAPAADASEGDDIAGELLLPSGPLPVVVSVRAVVPAGRSASGEPTLDCEFRWGIADERNQLETFLFGSDLQWQLNGLRDRMPTPLERMEGLIGREAAGDSRRLARNTWSPVLYKRVNLQAGSGVGFISGADPRTGARTIVSLGVLPTNVHVYAEEVTAAGPRGVVGRVEAEQILETHASPIYLYRLTA